MVDINYKNIYIIYTIGICEYLGNALITSLLPFYAQNSSSFIYSLLFSAYSISQFICIYIFILLAMTISGILSDKIGRKKTIIINLFGSSICIFILVIVTFIQIFAKKPEYLIVCRFLVGLFSSSIVSCQAYISDCVKGDKKSPYITGFFGCATISFTIGPLLGSLLYKIYKWMPFLVGSIFLFIMLIVTIFFLDESPKQSIINEEKNENEIDKNKYIPIVFFSIL